ncbi:CDP-alcohol phosphatidyltransferase family protein [Myroides sp. M-43]|uniref:CDP-alcohol phosphatidyltransferase family protein n=1 Tax=Myroides oncorhynchi TaxID=2893756 RepID=UPI001E5F0A96|nr:CDP-alcohol phosphatidyltransferase family protein [Myroides oncorhynchi]MCC9042956.1 CDP-alcohol phosphatidyltransferase family protein [Myroides oncorhynchi]
MKTPHLLILLRFLFAPTILLLAMYASNESRNIIVILMILGLLSDIFDGIIARKQNISTIKQRRLDSQVDLIFWLSIGISCYILNPEIIKTYKIGIILVLVMEMMCYLISFIKFRKETCTHAFLSKIWGLLLFSSFVSIIGFDYGGLIISITLIWGIISQLDVILIILILPKWQNDIPSCYHSYLIRKGIPFKKSKLLND